ncbi:response regulator [Sporichthya sp.]|uniref:response regulator n=1 Tax=Sporichthya sp. TaxID=65475 RepID=UPI0025DF95F7|nr:response regulator [Sporichthya sp.]
MSSTSITLGTPEVSVPGARSFTRQTVKFCRRDRLAAQFEDWDVACTVADDLSAALQLAAEGGLWQVGLVPAGTAAANPSQAAALAAGAPSDGPRALVALTNLQAGFAPLDRTLFRAELATPVRVGALTDVLVPLVAPHAALPGQRSDSGDLGEAVPPLRILLVEDNAVNQEVGRLLLRSLGQEDVEIAGNGREAVESAAARPFDLVLMDVQMPELDGFSATRRIRELDLPWAQPRIIALTAAASGAHLEACADAGMDDYLSKPIRVEALLAVLRGITPSTVAAGPRSPAEGSTLDREVLRALLGQLGRTEASAGDLVAEFLEDTASNLARLRTALAAADQPAVTRIAHRIRPTCSLFGAAELAGLLAGLEAGTARPMRAPSSTPRSSGCARPSAPPMPSGPSRR